MPGVGLALTDTAITGHAALSAWWPYGANMVLDFTGNRTMSNKQPVETATLLNCSRASTAWAKNNSGAWLEFAPNTLRITDKGLLVELAATNYLLNSDAPATQSVSLTAGDYTLWVEGTGSAALSGDATGTAMQGSHVSFTLSASGNVTITISGALDVFQLENNPAYTAGPSSFIKTAGVAAARAVDDITFSDLSWLTQGLGTFLLETDDVRGPNLSRIMNDSSYELDFAYYYTINVKWYAASAYLTAAPGDGFDWTQITKVAGAYEAGSRSLVCHGGAVAGDTQTVGTVNNLRLGSNGFKSINGFIRSITYWPERKSDAEIQGLTT